MSKEPGVSVHSGFPNPATDQTLTGLELQQLLVKHPASTFFMQISGSQWEERGIYDGDVIAIDRSLSPRVSDYVVWWDDSQFVVSRPADIPAETTSWGVVSSVIHRLRP